MSNLHIADVVEHGKRKAKVRDFKWNMVYIEYLDGEYEWVWVDRRDLKKVSP